MKDCDDSKGDSDGDFIILGPKTEDGKQMGIRHRADHTVEMAQVIPMEEGKPMVKGAELLHISGEGPVYKVESVYDGRRGPSKVATKSYRDGYDRVFSGTNAKDMN